MNHALPSPALAADRPMRRLDGDASRPAARTVLATSSFNSTEMPHRCGDDCYSYYFVQRAFLPLLRRWAEVREVEQGSSLLENAVAAARLRRSAPVHLSFLPPQYMPLATDAANVAFPFWEYPDVPHYDVAGNPRFNWLRLTQRIDAMVTACEFTRAAFERAGARVPMHVVPVPIADGYFNLPDWQPDQTVALDCRCYLLPQPEVPMRSVSTVARAAAQRTRQHLLGIYRRCVRPYLPVAVHRRLASTSRGLVPAGDSEMPEAFPIAFAPSDRLELSGVVYVSILNPFDIRKDWQSLLKRFLQALGDRDDATLVIKLALSRTMRQEGLHHVLHFYQRLGRRHRCRIAVVADYLSDEQMQQLARASTYYLNTSKAEGLCMPLQDALAAGRPGIAPAHTAMAEYIDERLAFVVPSRDEPTYWPWDPERRLNTTWQRLDGRRLAEQTAVSYRVAVYDLPRYREMSAAARERMSELASDERVWPKLSEVLNQAMNRYEQKRKAA